MTRRLQLLMTLLLLVGSVWAEDFTPILDVSFRTNASNNGWESNYPKSAADDANTDFELTSTAGFFALQKYTVADLRAAKQMVLTLTVGSKSGVDAVKVWLFDNETWTAKSSFSDIVPSVQTKIGVNLRATEGTANTPDIAGAKVTDSNPAKATFTISGANLAAIKKNATYDESGNGTFSLLLTNDNLTNSSNKRSYLSSNSSNAEANRPKLAVTYAPVWIGDTSYETLNAAVAAAADADVISILKDCELSANITFSKSLTIAPAYDDRTIKISASLTGNYYAFGLATAGTTVQIGANGYKLTIDGQSTSLGDKKLFEVTNGQINLSKVALKDVYTASSQGVVCVKSSGKAKLSDIAFDGCQATATDAGLVFCGLNDGIILSGNNTFNSCTGYGLYLERRFTVDETNGVTHTAPITVFVKTSNIALGNPIATKVLSTEADKFFVMNEDYAIYPKGTSSNRADLTVCEGKSLSVTSAGAATLVLPFAATIPTGVTCYTLAYTSGTSVEATEMTGGTLAANTPVLVNASAGTYKFKNSTNATTATAFTVTDTPTSGALTGVFQETTVPAGKYILYKGDDGLGFYKADGSTNKVAANRAYLTADGAGARVNIVFDGETTDVREKVAANSEQFATAPVYNLAGQRVSAAHKGIVIVNGKKYVNK